MIFFAGENGKMSPICWNSKRFRCVVRSNLASETLAMADVIDAGVFLSKVYGKRSRERNRALKCITGYHALHAVYSNKFCKLRTDRIPLN